MIALLQRVAEAQVCVDGKVTGRIGSGLLVLVGFEQGDRRERLDRLLERILNYRIFSDDAGRMNFSLRDTDGGLLLVPQFTLAADTDRGNRPSFTPAAAPQEGRALFEDLVRRAREIWPTTRTGIFGAHMQVALVNDGPVTFRLVVSPD